ncbi:MAG: glycosyl transferase family 1 [Chloroflexota bacterium]|nr:glycosyltransferase [Ardenticatenaceae bacterium]GIK57619.1 MAG: glycosyl transferase family 1 [Chloroflexota bacterium]
MRILFLSGWYPEPPNNGSKLRILNLLRGLAQHHEVTLLSFSDDAQVDVSTSELRTLCPQIEIVPANQFIAAGWRARLGFFSLTPRSVLATRSAEMEKRLAQLLANGRYDLIIASQLGPAGYSDCFQGVPALLEEVEVALLRERYTQATALQDKARHGLTWAKQKRYLKRLLADFRACTVVSEQEKALVAEVSPAYRDVTVIPNCINLAEYKAVAVKPEPNRLIFTGSFRYHANHEAMTWFLGEVFPLILAKAPDVQLTITGDHANLPLPSLKNVTLTGFVDDVRTLIASSWLSLSPLLVGGGTRLKILEAMALHTPVVATSKGAEGLDARPGEHLLIADTPQAYAEAVLLLWRDPALRQRLADNAYQFVAEQYDCAVTIPRFLALVERVADV